MSAFLLGRQCIGRPDRRRERVVGSPGRDGRDQQGRREHRRRCDPLSVHVSALAPRTRLILKNPGDQAELAGLAILKDDCVPPGNQVLGTTWEGKSRL